jgi:hypothetical protein
MNANDLQPPSGLFRTTEWEYHYLWMRAIGYDHWDSLRKGIDTWQTAMANVRASR